MGLAGFERERRPGVLVGCATTARLDNDAGWRR